MSILVNRILQLAGCLGTVEGLERVNRELSLLDRRLADHDTTLSRDEVAQIQTALAVLGNAISEMNRVALEMLAEAGTRGIDHVG